MAARSEVLIASPDLEICRILTSILSQWGLEAICCSTVSKAKALLARQIVPLVFCEDRLSDGSFRDLLRAAELAKTKVRMVVLSRMGEGNGYLEAPHTDAFNAILCPCRPAEVQRVIFDAMREDGQEQTGVAFADDHKIQAFYDRWKAPVFRFCLLFLGGEKLAGKSTCEAFLNYLREKLVLQTSALPPRLMGFALSAAEQHSMPVSQAGLPSQSFAQAVLCIPCDQRAVFIMCGVLGMSALSVSSAMGLPVARVRRLWLSSLLNLRELLPRNFFERGNGDSGREEQTHNRHRPATSHASGP